MRQVLKGQAMDHDEKSRKEISIIPLYANNPSYDCVGKLYCITVNVQRLSPESQQHFLLPMG